MLWNYYCERWREIDLEWDTPMLTFEGIGTIRHVKRAARNELREEVRVMATRSPGTYIVPV
jgi:hypothetical protein